MLPEFAMSTWCVCQVCTKSFAEFIISSRTFNYEESLVNFINKLLIDFYSFLFLVNIVSTLIFLSN